MAYVKWITDSRPTGFVLVTDGSSCWSCWENRAFPIKAWKRAIPNKEQQDKTRIYAHEPVHIPKYINKLNHLT